MSHSPESQETGGLGTRLLLALAKQVNRFHAQSDVALHCCCLSGGGYRVVWFQWKYVIRASAKNFIRASAKET